MIIRIVIFLYAISAYLVFVGSFLYAACFVGNLTAPRSMDIGAGMPTVQALAIDLLLLGAFCVQHSVMARQGFKRWWTRTVPLAAERSTYVLISSVLLLMLCWWWQAIPALIWHADGIAAALLAALCWVGWSIALASSFMIDHFHLFGLSQGYAALRSVAAHAPAFKTPCLYRLVRHPLMSGLLVAFWATPIMTAGHLLFAVTTTAYIIVGVWLEERDLSASLGESYRLYRERVPMLLPLPRRRATGAILDKLDSSVSP